LFELPAINVVVSGHPREPLRNLVNVVFISWKELISGAAIDAPRIVDVVVPIDAKDGGLTRGQWTWQIDTHHGMDDCVRQRHSLRILYRGDVFAAFEIASGNQGIDSREAGIIQIWRGLGRK